MNITVSTLIDAPKEKVWEAISDFTGAEQVISGIKKIEILEKPEKGLVGLKWRETREMFGKEATEVMWITSEEKGVQYKTRAESHGSIYETVMRVEKEGNKTRLSMDFSAKAQNFFTVIMSATIGLLFKGATKKALQKDLEDVKAHMEK